MKPLPLVQKILVTDLITSHFLLSHPALFYTRIAASQWPVWAGSISNLHPIPTNAGGGLHASAWMDFLVPLCKPMLPKSCPDSFFGGILQQAHIPLCLRAFFWSANPQGSPEMLSQCVPEKPSANNSWIREFWGMSSSVSKLPSRIEPRFPY